MPLQVATPEETRKILSGQSMKESVEYDPKVGVYGLKFAKEQNGKHYAPLVPNFDYTPYMDGKWHVDPNKHHQFGPSGWAGTTLRNKLSRLGLTKFADAWPIPCQRGWHVWSLSAWARCFTFSSYDFSSYDIPEKVRSFWLVKLKGNAAFNYDKAAFTHIQFVDELELDRDALQAAALDPKLWAEMLELPKGSHVLWRCSETMGGTARYDIRKV